MIIGGARTQKKKRGRKMPYRAIVGLAPTMMGIGLVGRNIASVTKKGGMGLGSMMGMGVRTLVGIPLISKVSGLIAGL